MNATPISSDNIYLQSWFFSLPLFLFMISLNWFGSHSIISFTTSIFNPSIIFPGIINLSKFSMVKLFPNTFCSNLICIRWKIFSIEFKSNLAGRILNISTLNFSVHVFRCYHNFSNCHHLPTRICLYLYTNSKYSIKVSFNKSI